MAVSETERARARERERGGERVRVAFVSEMRRLTIALTHKLNPNPAHRLTSPNDGS